jgi:hypothetical protein
MLRVFWAGMDSGGFNAAIAQDVLRFNGKLFKGANASGYVLPLNTRQVDGLLRAARANWKEVEPAIFGTLLERALDSRVCGAPCAAHRGGTAARRLAQCPGSRAATGA